jgi:hypothetical protein
VNKQIISTVIIWLFVLPALWYLQSTFITDTTILHKIEGTVGKFECKQKDKRFNGKSFIYYADNKKEISFYDNFLRNKNFLERCQELSQQIKVDRKFTAITINTYNQVLDLKVGSKTILNFDDKVSEFNHKNNIFIGIFLFIGMGITIMNIIIWFYKFNPDNWVKSSFFQGMLYFIAIMAIIRYIFDL